MPACSVILPMYNEERYILRCLDSLREQTFQDIEIILIDDGSTDATITQAETFQSQFPTTILRQAHGGPGKARNWWASIAQWAILVFVDADMFFDKEYLKKLVEPIIDGTEVGTSHGTELVGNLSHPIARAYGAHRGPIFTDNQRSVIFRAIKKEVFLQTPGYTSTGHAFEDHLGDYITNGARFVQGAICYHNNPESLREIFDHEVWIWSSLIKTGELKTYVYKYRYLLGGVCIAGLLLVAIALVTNRLLLLITIPLLPIAVFCAIAVWRSLAEKSISNLVYVPVVMFTRLMGYLFWALKSLSL